MARWQGIVQPDPVSYTATLGSESVTVTFDNSKMTGLWERDVRHAIAADDADKVSELLFGVFISWDVVDDQGAPVPISTEVLLQLPGKALVAMFQGMQEAASPSSEEGNVSAITSSSPTDDSSSTQDSLLNGQSPSLSPTPSASPSPT